MQVRAGVRQKVAAALEQAEALEAKIDVKQAEHRKAMAAINEDKSVLQQKLADNPDCQPQPQHAAAGCCRESCQAIALLALQAAPCDHHHLRLVLTSYGNASVLCLFSVTVPVSISMLRHIAINH